MWLVYLFSKCGECTVTQDVIGVSSLRMWLVYYYYVNHSPPEHYLQGYLSHEKPPPPLEPSQGPRQSPTVGSQGGNLFL
jgi:hypothetical protein